MDFFEVRRQVKKRGGWKKCAKEAGAWTGFKLWVLMMSGMIGYLYYVSTLPKMG
jgi:hypothetical protein